MNAPVDGPPAEDPLTRVRLTKANMDALKRSPEAVAVMALFNLSGRAPKAVEDFAVDLFARKPSLVLTNVAGPQRDWILTAMICSSVYAIN